MVAVSGAAVELAGLSLPPPQALSCKAVAIKVSRKNVLMGVPSDFVGESIVEKATSF